jgi:hypothetical protein
VTATYYKWLNGRKSCHGGDAAWRKGAWKTVTGELVPCQNGLHLCRRQDLLEWIGPTLWVAEVDGEELIAEENKIVVRRARIVEQLAWDDRLARLFAADCAERVLPLFEKARPDDDRPRRAIEACRLSANGQISTAAWAAAWAAARAAAGDAARDASWAAARDAAWAASWAAARAAARDAAWAAARAAARDAAWAEAGDAAWSAERGWQTTHLLKYAHGRAA